MELKSRRRVKKKNDFPEVKGHMQRIFGIILDDGCFNQWRFVFIYYMQIFRMTVRGRVVVVVRVQGRWLGGGESVGNGRAVVFGNRKWGPWHSGNVNNPRARALGQDRAAVVTCAAQTSVDRGGWGDCSTRVAVSHRRQ